MANHKGQMRDHKNHHYKGLELYLLGCVVCESYLG